MAEEMRSGESGQAGSDMLGKVLVPIGMLIVIGVVALFAVQQGAGDGEVENSATADSGEQSEPEPAQPEPATDLVTPDPEPSGGTEPAGDEPVAAIDPAVMEAGETQYILCSACHGADGDGVANLAPPLAKSEWVNGPPENLIRIQLRGLQGPITVKGQEYSFAAPMVAQAFQTDEQIASVLTYVRNSFGNKAPAVTPDQVKALRGEVGKPPLTVEDLIPPTGAE